MVRGLPTLGEALKSPASMVVLRVALLWTVGYLFFVFHGLSFHLTPWSQAFINAIVEYTYGTAGQRDTTVVLFREENLRQLGVQYPVPYAVHAQVVEALASYGPRAVFVDFAFIDERESEDELAAALCGLRRARRETPTPVFVAAPGGTSVRPRLLACAAPASPEMLESVGVSGVLTYVSRGSDGLPTAAFALAATNPALGLDPGARTAPLEIVWGKGVAPLNRRWMHCTEPSLLLGIWHMLVHGPLANKLTCPYARTITVGHLLGFAADRDVEDAVRGRTVFYGAGFRLTGDVVNSPVYAELPGVYLHAMAYDNLVTFGPHYKRATRNGVGAKLTDAVLLLVAAVLLVRYPRTPPRRPQSFTELRADVRRRVLGAAGVVLAVVAVVAAGGFDVGLLGVVLAYVLYRWRVSHDLGFVLLVAITLATALFYYYVMDLGPRNILAFLVFFEVVRHVEKHVKEMAARYFELRSREATPPAGALWRWADAFLARYVEPGTARIDETEVVHEAKQSSVAG